jgi:hypothetical protein
MTLSLRVVEDRPSGGSRERRGVVWVGPYDAVMFDRIRAG